MFIVEGNIGTGKTTFLKALHQSLTDSKVFLEAVDYWQNESQGQSILENFYNDPKRWAYSMESITLKIRIQEHLAQQNTIHPLIVERSIYSGLYCFAFNSFEQGFLTQLEWNIYNSWFHFLTSKNCLPPHGFIYLQANPQISYQRTLRRDRQAENSISLQYLEQIHDRHEKFLITKENIHPSIVNIPVLVLDCNYDFITDKKKLSDYIELVRQFIHQHYSQTTSEKIIFSENLHL